jgi:hypothetical protein
MIETIDVPDEVEPSNEVVDDGVAWGRPLEDRGFEAVEAGAGFVAGLALGTAIAGPIGAAVGGVVGAAAGLIAGEALERHEGRAATTTDATAPDER